MTFKPYVIRRFENPLIVRLPETVSGLLNVATPLTFKVFNRDCAPLTVSVALCPLQKAVELAEMDKEGAEVLCTAAVILVILLRAH